MAHCVYTCCKHTLGACRRSPHYRERVELWSDLGTLKFPQGLRFPTSSPRLPTSPFPRWLNFWMDLALFLKLTPAQRRRSWGRHIAAHRRSRSQQMPMNLHPPTKRHEPDVRPKKMPAVRLPPTRLPVVIALSASTQHPAKRLCGATTFNDACPREVQDTSKSKRSQNGLHEGRRLPNCNCVLNRCVQGGLRPRPPSLLRLRGYHMNITTWLLSHNASLGSCHARGST